MDLSAIRLQTLQYIVEIAKCGSINRAAQNLFISQPNLTASLRALEGHLGYPIFHRSSAGVVPTEKGRHFLNSASIILSETENMKKIPDLCESNAQSLSLVSTYSAFLLRQFLLWRREHPSPGSDTFKETGLIQTLQDIIAKKYRIGFFYDFEDGIGKRRLIAEKYYLELSLLRSNLPITALMRQGHPLSALPAVPVSALAAYGLVTFENFDYEDWLGMIGLPERQNILYVFDRGGMAETLHDSESVGIAHDFEPHSPYKGLVARPLCDVKGRLNLYEVHAASYLPSEAERGFLRFLRRKLQQLP